MADKNHKKEDAPVVTPTDTGGLRIDSKQLFTTEKGQQALRRLMEAFKKEGIREPNTLEEPNP